jgi:DNA polymerase I-like protein with 3'-5' exonuclease and polymerase domains
VPDDQVDKVHSFAVAFDQGQETEQARLPLGAKPLDARHTKRVTKWVAEHGPQILAAPNQQPSEWGRLLRELSRMRLVIHNAKHDLHQFRAGLRGCEGLPPERGGGLDLEPAVVSCTQIAQAVIDPRYGTALKSTSVRLNLGAELGLDEGTEDQEQLAMKPWLGPKTDARYDLVPWGVSSPYAKLDAALHLLLWEWQQSYLNDPTSGAVGMARHVGRETALMRTLYRMETRGVGYDAAASRKEADKAQAMADAVAGSLPFKPTYPGAQKYFFGPEFDEAGEPTGNLGHLPYNDKITKGGKPQVDEESIRRLADEDVPHAKQFARWAELNSAISKWFGAWAEMTGADGRLRTNHRQASVISGRLAVERAQLQAIPQPYQIPEGLRQVRELFVAKPGHTLWEIDVSQAEIRIATALARCQPMLDQFLEGRDSHSAACWLMFRNEFRYDDGTPMASLEEAEQQHPRWHEYRQVSKRCNLGILYGAGVNTIRSEIKKFTGVEYEFGLVRRWIEQWRAAFPPFVKFLESSARLAERHGHVRLMNGRLRYFSHFEPTHKAGNQRVQGSQAEAIKDSLVRVDREMPGSVLLCIHDSIVAEFPTDTGESLAQAVAGILVQEFEHAFAKPWVQGGPRVVVPFKADVKRFGAKN